MRNARPTALLAAALLVMPTATFAAGWQFGAQAGASIPTGDFLESRDAETGYIFGLFADHPFASWALGANFSMTGNNHAGVGVTEDLGGSTYTLNEDKYSTTQFGAHAKYVFPTGGNIDLYGILGVGLTKFRENATSTYATPGVPDDIRTQELESDWEYSGKLGAGALWWLSEMWGISSEADYNFIVLDDGLPYFSLCAGAVFRIPRAK